MALLRENLSLVSQAIGGVFRRYGYLTTDSLDTVVGNGYFNAADELRPGDVIDVIVTDSLDPDLRTTAEVETIYVQT